MQSIFSKQKTKRIDRDTFNSKVEKGKIIIGGLGNLQGVRITRITKNSIWYK